jgi:DNA-binding XRE family transcriptional regulator
VGIPENINRLMAKQGISRYKLAKLSDVPYTTLIKVLDGTTKNPQIETLISVAEALGTSVDKLSGQSIGALIEDRLLIANSTMESLAEITGIPLEKLQDIDNAQPQPWDYETGGIIDKLSKALFLSKGVLSAAFSRQEPSSYEGPRSSPADDFSDIDTIAAHHDGDVWSEEELEEIERFKEFVKSKRKSEE